MPLVGGGGSPNVAGGGNPAGTSSTLNYVGNHAYGYSGTFPTTTSTQTMMEFNTFHNTYIVGEFVLMGGLKYASTSNGRISVFKLTVNGEIIAVVKSDPQSADYTGDVRLPILLEPASRIKLEVIGNDGSADDVVTAIFVGRAYA